MFGNKRYYERTIESLQDQLRAQRAKETRRLQLDMVDRQTANREKRLQEDLKAVEVKEKAEAVDNYKYDLQQVVIANAKEPMSPEVLVAHCVLVLFHVQEATNDYEQSLVADDE